MFIGLRFSKGGYFVFQLPVFYHDFGALAYNVMPLGDVAD